MAIDYLLITTCKLIDGKTNTLVKMFDVGGAFAAIAVNVHTDRVYALNIEKNAVFVVDGKRRTIVATVKVGKQNPSVAIPETLVVNPCTNRVYVANTGGNTVSVIGGRTNKVIKTITVGKTPDSLAINLRTNRIYAVTSTAGGTVAVIDGRRNRLLKVISGVGAVGTMGVNPVTNRIYAPDDTTGSRNVSVIDGATNKVIATVVDGESPRLAIVSRKLNRIFVVTSEEDAPAGHVVIINGANNRIIATVRVGRDTSSGVVNERNNRVYVTNQDGSTVSVISGK